MAAGGTSCESLRVSDEAIVQLIHERPRLPTALIHMLPLIYITLKSSEKSRFLHGITHENSPVVYVAIRAHMVGLSNAARPSKKPRLRQVVGAFFCFFFFFFFFYFCSEIDISSINTLFCHWIKHSRVITQLNFTVNKVHPNP